MGIQRKRGYRKPPRTPRSEFEALRKSLKMSQTAFGEALGIHKQIVYSYERGVSSPTPNSWLKICESAAQHGIELSDSLYQDLMRMKSERLLKRLNKRIQQIRESQSSS